MWYQQVGVQYYPHLRYQYPPPIDVPGHCPPVCLMDFFGDIDSDVFDSSPSHVSPTRTPQPPHTPPPGASEHDWLLAESEVLSESPIALTQPLACDYSDSPPPSLPPYHSAEPSLPPGSLAGSPSPPPLPPAQAGPAGRQGGAKHWVFTLNHYCDDEFVHIGSLCDPAAPGPVRYLVMGREVGEGGTPHLQGYVELSTRKRLIWLKDNVSLRAHWEMRHGPRDAARDYCMKDGDWFETGEWVVEERGRRRDVETMVEQASQGMPFYDAAIDEPSTALFPHAYTKLLEGRALSLIKPFREVEVVVKIGPTGCGKTRAAYADHWPDMFVQDCSSGGEIWWDGYNGQSCLLLDDYDGCLPYRYLLRILDVYPIRVKVKGAHTYGSWSKVLITTNVPVSAWYPKRADVSHLQRRIARVERYIGVNDFVVEHF